jgi:hypothetical protein
VTFLSPSLPLRFEEHFAFFFRGAISWGFLFPKEEEEEVVVVVVLPSLHVKI